MNTFFYKTWWLYYLLFFLLLGVLIYALLWQPVKRSHVQVLTKQLEDCRQAATIAATKPTLPITTVNCNAKVNSGGQGFTRTKHVLGNNSGTVILQYDTQLVPDELKLIYEDKVVAVTDGMVSGQGELKWHYDVDSGKPNYCYVEVSAPNDNTVWEYIVNCPN
ncbi:hypothetical protein FAZ19_09875 [Sphingobacterium alkalisoli]|uniref:Uncharacterized protein n=1 Tax=Sphingobacterium alkalisoli TaxID=1874115 RepID=A0A4U0H2X8_9SPHI|nr:hypothetical protein [Sphingobacterium alkalisoli]TJY65444.1 hypothetical protein FAZ19_09875 [Sphingobacterium alkalisoli]GGH20423.1 hypothetical protein GCM10011418_25610 [Sphingobacterium alkalisoli]